MPFTESTDITIYYERAGAGEKVLYIGGTGADLRVTPNVFAGPLAKVSELVAYDQRGLGQTEKPDADYTMAQYAADAAQLLDELDWPAVSVVGVSFGGMVALQLALDFPEKIKKLVLCCTSPGGKYASYPLHDVDAELNVADKTRLLMAINDTRRDQSWQQKNPDMVTAAINITEKMRHPDALTEAFKVGARKQLLARYGHDVSQQLGSIKMPVLICAGKYDGIAAAENQAVLEREIPDSQLKWYEGGHLFLLQDKQAWQDINAFLGV